MIYEYAKSLGIEIKLGCSVTEYWEDESIGQAGVVADGVKLTADVVVGADGVRSKARQLILASR